ncbi:MAG TPA: leucine--tRNA ligase [Candidatus Scatocola faecipullorum]|uniref:Leucine--tRNA ligase n=1 Tax=Candidatus Scatocola faecipullorum TaxID=2840917 RepID=A0A9D1M4N6_9PROT|nr:leucine--tRNA ligase [Candidatus Scatocola faecipullorum]
MEERYNFHTIEEKWQKIWEDEKAYKVEIDKNKKKFYALVEFPYPSGAGLHVGHPRSYTALDVIARKKRMQGFNVLYPMGFDAFGLPAENYAIKTGVHPAVSTAANIANFTKQMKSIGFSFDWDRCISTCDPEYYKWTQWMFIKLFEKGLAYKDKMAINWCPSCKVGLANEEVVNGCCERCGAQVVRKNKEQWMVAITKYADRLIDDLQDLDFIDRVKSQQINWIGRSEGAELDFGLTDGNGTELPGKKLTVFTTRPDTAFGVTYMVLAPEHPYVAELASRFENAAEVQAYVEKTATKSDLQRSMDESKTGVELKGIKAKNPYNGKLIPIFISDYVLMGYGTGAIMAVPAHDQRDYDFAKAFNLPIIQVLAGGDIAVKAHEEDGAHINSEFLDGMNKEDGMRAAIDYAVKHGFGKSKINYKLRDWVFSRQRYWGEPIPMVYCEHCGWQPIPESELPLTLPPVPDYHPNDEGESPLSKAGDEWLYTKCPKCGAKARRETDTMPNWAGSSWYFLRYCDPHNSKEFASKEALDYWMNVDWYNGGMEHTTLHLLYSRFWHKFLYDLGLVPTKEPYQRRTSHGMILAENGEKMSKSRGNVINPDDIIAAYGADTFRLYEMFIGPFDQVAMWSDESLMGVYRFVSKVYSLFAKVDGKETATADDLRAMHKCILEVTERIDQMKFNTAVSSMMTYVNYLSAKTKIAPELYSTLIKLLSPFTPHLAEEMWARLGNTTLVVGETWPQGDAKLAEDQVVTYAVQLCGKMRGTIEMPKDAGKEEIQAQAMALENVKRQIEGKEIVKVIVVPNRLINIVVKG